MELRRESVPTCPACAGEGDRIHLSSKWELMDQAHATMDELGCCCTPGAEGCDSQVDVGSQVVIFGQSRSSGLNGQRAQTLWWDCDGQCWEVLVLASRQVMRMHTSELALAEACGGADGLSNCPCWPSGRGLYPVSLGNRCCVKLGIDECSGDAHCPVGYPYFHGAEYLPFDSLLTSLDAVLHFLRHDFANFFHYNDMIDVHPPGLPNIIFHNYRSWMHTFPHHHPQSDQAKLDRRIRRFRVLCRHSRDVRGSRPLQFVRYVGESPHELHRLEELYSILRLWGGSRARLCFVAMLQHPQAPQASQRMPPDLTGRSALTSGLSAKSVKGGRLFRHDIYPKVLFWLVDGLVNVMDFGPIRQALRFNVYDEAGLLHDVPSISTASLIATLRPFKDPYTNKSANCDRTWLERPPAKEKDIALGFFPDCPRAQQPDQGYQTNNLLRSAIRRGDAVRVRELLRDGSAADANTWDGRGRRPLHDLCEAAAAGRGQVSTLHLAAELLLAHGDPRARDKDGKSVLDEVSCVELGTDESTRLLAQKPFLRELVALLAACSLQGVTEQGFADPAGLFRGLELLGEPKRSQIALGILGLAALRPIGPAELKWRNPGPGLEEQLAALDDELAAIKRLKETSQRRRALRRMLFEWHPDKNSHRHELAKAAFQHIQMQKADILEKGRAPKHATGPG
ncbi:Pol [Symbiodinium natans]|uniref:Pol protein n=1 Tax=Symbiodinium natans TaxID=878477 RepID=A0A812U8V6_9DINO|nr:Pol [Symbiodinium natans]